MSSKDKYGKFKKKDYLRTIRACQEYFCGEFGYLIKPFLIETRLRDGCLMEFVHYRGAAAIFYDYKQFKELFGNQSFETQEICAASILAHEMRHYYQYRQMYAKKPRESAERIARWRENEENPIGIESEGLSFFLQPLELDASLFEYVFCAETFGLALLDIVWDERHLDALEQLYVEYCGETEPQLFHGDVRKKVLALHKHNA